MVRKAVSSESAFFYFQVLIYLIKIQVPIHSYYLCEWNNIRNGLIKTFIGLHWNLLFPKKNNHEYKTTKQTNFRYRIGDWSNMGDMGVDKATGCGTDCGNQGEGKYHCWRYRCARYPIGYFGDGFN